MSSATTRVLSALVLLPAVLGLIWYAPHEWLVAFVVLIMAIAGNELRSFRCSWLEHSALVIFWIIFPLSVLLVIHSRFGPGALMILAGVIVVSDSAQYFTGRAFGRNKLAPVISPKKTVEGAIGGLVFGGLAAVGLARIWPVGLGDLAMAATGLAMSIAGIVGDLFESALKRRAGIKDSGSLIPGHGGILDRIDSWLFAGPVFWLILRLAEMTR